MRNQKKEPWEKEANANLAMLAFFAAVGLLGWSLEKVASPPALPAAPVVAQQPAADLFTWPKLDPQQDDEVSRQIGCTADQQAYSYMRFFGFSAQQVTDNPQARAAVREEVILRLRWKVAQGLKQGLEPAKAWDAVPTSAAREAAEFIRNLAQEQ